MIQNKKALHRKAEGYTDHFGASPSHRSWSPLGRDSARATHTNMYIRNGRLEQDTSTSLRIGHFYFAVTLLRLRLRTNGHAVALMKEH